MKRSLLTFTALLFITNIYCQPIPVIESVVSTYYKIGDETFQDWQKIYEINKKKWEQNLEDEELEAPEKKFIQQMREKYRVDYFEDYEYPWNLHSIGCSWYCGASYEVLVSSELAPAGNNFYTANKLSDDDMRTAWVEGVPGYGIGEYILFRFPRYAARATNVTLVNGYGKSETTWRNNSRVKTFELYDDEKLIAVVHLKDTRNPQYFDLPYPFPERPDDFSYEDITEEDREKYKELKFVIKDVYKGDKYDDTAISEIMFDGLDVHCLAKGSRITMGDGSIKSIENIRKGDQLKAYDTTRQMEIITGVKHIHRAVHNQMLRLSFENNMQIITTADHPFFTSQGWMSYFPERTKQYRKFSSLAVGRYETNTSFYFYISPENVGITKLVSVEKLENTIETYTLELESKNAAYIANGFLAGQE